MANTQKTHTPPAVRFHVGDHVRFPFPDRMVEAVVTEDRGCIGWKGRRLLQVEIVDENGGTGRVLEMPEEELEPA